MVGHSSSSEVVVDILNFLGSGCWGGDDGVSICFSWYGEISSLESVWVGGGDDF